ncbi:MAG: hypothetical protein GWN29_04630, partial [Gammaproteobacteria bacterium]|nr:hypothetical protein [Gammaproteobacteria bacterium]
MSFRTPFSVPATAPAGYLPQPVAARATVLTGLTLAAALSAVLPAAAQSPPPSALVNQRSSETLEAARAVSPHSPDETYAYFETEVDAAMQRAIDGVWDPSRMQPSGLRTPWGDPNVAGS